MKWLWITPDDVWLFRDGRPFVAGEEHAAHTLFPPSPLTVQGAIRSLVLGNSPVGWQEFKDLWSDRARQLAGQIGHPAGLGVFAMAGPFLARQEDKRVVRYTPLPADVMRAEDGSEYRYYCRRPQKAVIFATDWPATGLYPLWPPGKDLKAPSGSLWLDEDALKVYLNDGQGFGILPGKELFTREERLGIALHYEYRRAQERMLYQAHFIRPQDKVGLLVGLDERVGLPAESGILALGGESRAAHYRVLPANQVNAAAGLDAPTSRFKLVLFTPAWFSGGWQPQGGDWSSLLGVKARLIAAALLRPQGIGGWDLAYNRPADLRACVPAGSVYFFETDTPIASLPGPLTETPAGELDRGRLGFGQFALGQWDWLDSEANSHS